MDDLNSLANAVLANAPALALVIGTIVAIGVIVVIVILLWPRKPPHDPAAEQRMADLNARVQIMGELLAKAQSQLQQTVHERLDAVTARLGESMQNSTQHTAEHLQQLNARLAVIDHAQRNITDLASQVTSLQNVLSNKQTRGAFGQARMEMIIQDGLPRDCYEFQATLSNKARPDCVVHLPDGPSLVIDAKFPLEAVTAFREAKSDEERKLAVARVRADITKHVSDIADKYLVEVGHLITDVQRLRDRVENLDNHFGQAKADIKQIVISTDKIINRGDRIQSVEFDDEPPPSAEVIQTPIRHKLEAGE